MSIDIYGTNIDNLALMVERVVRGDGDEEEEISWNLSTDVRYSNNKATGAIFIKKLAAIETDKPLPSQMRIITLSEVTSCPPNFNQIDLWCGANIWI